MPYPDLNFSEVTSVVVCQNLRPKIPRCFPNSLATVMKRYWDANPDKRPEMDDVVAMLEAIGTSKGGRMIPGDREQQGCFKFAFIFGYNYWTRLRWWQFTRKQQPQMFARLRLLDNLFLSMRMQDDNMELDNQVGNNQGDLHVQEQDDSVELDNQPLVDEVIRDSKKRNREANLATWKWNDVIDVTSLDDESIFDGCDDTLDDLLSMSNTKRKKREQVSVFSRNKIYRLIDEDDIFG
ncbi:serine-threonine/tyrosine-protein kinase catalytic domain-containing protein [Artemisia annua]|uniref:Serine-threonine/tyrosine-protein kinase catalytic domain-containing protein n=1 Tax=Artemisia annua TaxID=35608 RepID=A0A2U1NNL8_ARTAN|nr:serine-threonine/tyrosine-protein kinase catalytic domain-containing protein [Artemisia annua]